MLLSSLAGPIHPWAWMFAVSVSVGMNAQFVMASADSFQCYRIRGSFLHTHDEWRHILHLATTGLCSLLSFFLFPFPFPYCIFNLEFTSTQFCGFYENIHSLLESDEECLDPGFVSSTQQETDNAKYQESIELMHFHKNVINENIYHTVIMLGQTFLLLL